MAPEPIQHADYVRDAWDCSCPGNQPHDHLNSQKIAILQERVDALLGVCNVLRDRLVRCREYVPDNTWLADEIDSLTERTDD